MDIYFWQNIPSHIQAPGLRALAQIWPGQVRGVWCEAITKDRLRMGWQHPDFGLLQETLLKQDAQVTHAREIITKSISDVHVFSGFGAYAPIAAAFGHAVELGVEHLGGMAEPGIRMGWKGLLRPFRAKLLLRKYQKNMKFVLAKGLAGVDFYQTAGFSEGSLLPFMYQAEPASCLSDDTVSDPVRLIYVGKFIPRKGVDLMLKGLALCQSKSWRLTVVGDDENRPAMRVLASKLGIADKIDWLGAVECNSISQILCEQDLCLIPSRFEGWGVVANEAIQSGLGVICSDGVTSREIVLASGAGEVYPRFQPKQLAKTLAKWLDSPSRIVEAKRSARRFSNRLSPATVGNYLKEAVLHFVSDGERPQAPWLQPNDHVSNPIERVEEGAS